jgi:VWFA-related protein
MSRGEAYKMIKPLTTWTITCLTMCIVACAPLAAQSDGFARQSIPVRSDLVMLPVLVKSKAGEIMFNLTAQDFLVTDNGAVQSARLEESPEARPLAIALVVQTGGAAASHIRDYNGLDAVLDALAEAVPHHVAVVAFDSTPHLAQDFTTDTETASDAVTSLQPGDQKAAILDAIRYGIELLSKQPAEYRRALMLFGETVDGGSQATLDDVVRGLNHTNIVVYSFGFSSTKAAVSHEATKPKRPGGSPYHGDAYPADGCMSKDPDAAPDANGSRSHQAFDCAADLLPPLRLGRMVVAAATENLKRNVPKSVAEMTGGEYHAFKNAKTLRQGMVNLSNDLPNYYILSFHPASPIPGPHMLRVKLRRPGLRLQSRTIYWAEPSGIQ